MEQILNQFGVQPILLLAQVVNFLVLLWILKRLLYKPILKILEERKQKIAQSLKNAQEIEERLAKLSEEEQKRILKAVSEGEKVIQQASEHAASIIEDGKKEYERITTKAIEDAKVIAKMEQTKMMQTVKGNMADIVVLALQKIMGKSMPKFDQKRMVEETMKDLK